MNPFTPTDLVEASRAARASWARKSPEEKLVAFKAMGLLDQDGKLHPDYDWTPERYEREFGAAAK